MRDCIASGETSFDIATVVVVVVGQKLRCVVSWRGSFVGAPQRIDAGEDS